MPNDIFRWVIVIGVFLVLVAFVVETVAVYAMYRVIRATQKKILPALEALTPILGTVHRVLDDTAPKFSRMAGDAGDLVKGVSDRVLEEMVRIDAAVKQVQHACDTIRSAIVKQVKLVEGITRGIRVALHTAVHSRSAAIHHAQHEERLM